MYAIIVSGGKQYRVEVGDFVYLEKLEAAADDVVNFGEILAIGNEQGCTFGSPVVEGAKVAGKVVKHGKGKKITVLTYRAKKKSKRKMGHRQPYTKVEITEIVG